MKNFYEWLNENTAQVRVDDRKLRKTFQQEAEKVLSHAQDYALKVSQFNPQQFVQNIRTKLANYPSVGELIRSLESNNPRAIMAQQTKLRSWLLDQSYRDTSQLRDISRQIFIYIDSIERNSSGVSEEQIQQMVQQALVGTQQNMAMLRNSIEQAVARIPQWNSTAILIEPDAPSSEFGGREIAVAKVAEITLGQGEYAPKFTIFQDGENFEIDDVLEGGDTDFFDNPQTQADYFNLINELRKPGSTNKGRVLTLYTARPVQDREQFLQQQTLPMNIFLANDYEHVEGLAHDLSSKEARDVWKVRIDSRYLTQTLDGRVKYYQITVDNAPVVYLDLVSQGGSN